MAIIIILTIAAFLAATLSGIIGMGGGILLLATMSCFLAHGELVPLHAAVQFVSNGSRVIVFRKNVDWRTVATFTAGAVPGAVIAGVLLWFVGQPGGTEPYLKILIGVYILAAVLLPKRKKTPNDKTHHGFAALGFVAGAGGIVVGAIGPMIAPHFARRNFVKERLIATKAVCQAGMHLLKIPIFALLGTIEFAQFSKLLVAMAAAVVIGTLLGRRLLHGLSPQAFIRLYQVALVMAGLKVLIVDGLLKIAGR